MILSRTPLRVSFIGGGTDLPSFYENNDYGCVISTAINQYVYLGVNNRFDGRIRLAYSKNEIIDDISEIKNDRIQQVLKNLNISRGIEIFYISDVPKQMGLGGSSTFTVGLLNAIYKYKEMNVYPERLAREACNIEIIQLGNPIGKQDQYASAIGGLNYIKFWANGTVSIKPIMIDEEIIKSLLDNLIYIYLGQSHNASKILSDVNKSIRKTNQYLKDLRDLTDKFYMDLINKNISEFQYILKESWELKKKTSKRISNSYIDDLYKKAVKNGAISGKILGAGGGGYLMMYVPVEKQNIFRKIFCNYQLFKFEIAHSGSEIVYYG